MIGLITDTVRIDQYDYNWKNEFAMEKKILEGLLNGYQIDIQHVGSTSIEGCSAKPIIDIAIGIPYLDYGEQLVPILVAAGYIYKGNDGIEGRHYFKKVVDGLTTCHIHMEPIGGKIWNNHILFRDYLRKHPQEREYYEKIKLELALKFPNQRDIYAMKKSEYIESVYNKILTSNQ